MCFRLSFERFTMCCCWIIHTTTTKYRMCQWNISATRINRLCLNLPFWILYLWKCLCRLLKPMFNMLRISNFMCLMYCQLRFERLNMFTISSTSTTSTNIIIIMPCRNLPTTWLNSMCFILPNWIYCCLWKQCLSTMCIRMCHL